jgi:hypothetical protein
MGETRNKYKFCVGDYGREHLADKIGIRENITLNLREI